MRDADAAFVGRITQAVPQANGGPGGHVTYTFVVERARDAAMVGEVVSVGASADEGMCGVRFEERARWLIVAYATGGMLETNGCLPNGPMDEAPPEFQATVTELLPFEAEESSVEAERLRASGPARPRIFGGPRRWPRWSHRVPPQGIYLIT